MSEETKAAETKAEETKKVAEIIRGRMPVAVVALVRFGDNRNESTKDLANLFGTTVGKIDDIKKNRNFSYVKADFKPTQQQKDDAIEWLKRHPKFNDGAVDKVINELEAQELASAEEAAAFTSARVEARGQNPKTKTGEVADAGGGNNRKGKKAKKETTGSATAVEGDDLLS